MSINLIHKNIIKILIATILLSTLLLFSFTLKNSENLPSVFDLFNNSNALAQSETNQFGTPEPSPLTSRHSDQEADFSIFAVCSTEEKAWGEYNIYFGYENRTENTIKLSSSNLPYGRKISILDKNQNITNENIYYPNNSDAYSNLEPGLNPFFLQVQSYSTEDIIWEAQYENNGNKTKRTVRANPKYLPSCSKKDNKLVDSFERGFINTEHSSLNQKYLEELDPFLNVNIFTACTEFEFDESNNLNGRYNAVFGYRNESGSRINLTASQIFSRNDPIREIVHAHVDLTSQNLENLELIGNIDETEKTLKEDNTIPEDGFAGELFSPKEISQRENDLDINTAEDLKSLSSPIQYLRDGQENYAMIVRGYGSGYQNGYDRLESGGYSSGYGEDIIWTIKMDSVDEFGNIHTFQRESRANPLFSEPCGNEDFSKNNYEDELKDIQKQSEVKPNAIESIVNKFKPIEVYANNNISLGEPNYDEFCKSEFGQASKSISPLAPTRASKWVCIPYEIDLQDVCTTQYNSYAIAKNYLGGVYNWVCVKLNNEELGGMDLNKYCDDRKSSDYFQYGGVNADHINGEWYCIDARSLDIDKACKFTYGINSYSISKPHPVDNYLFDCLNGGGNSENDQNEINIDDDVNYDVTYSSLSEDYISNQDFDVTVTRDGNFFQGVVNDIADTTYNGLKNEIFKPIEEGLSCGVFNLSCKSRFGQAIYNAARIVVSYYSGMLKAIGEFITDTAKLIRDIFTNAKDLVQGMMTGVMQLIRNPQLFVDAILDEIDSFAKADIYSKAEKIGYFIGQFVPDIIIGILTGGGSVAAAVGTKVLQALDKVSDVLRTSAKVANIAKKFIGKTLKIGAEVSIKIAKVGTRIVMKGFELWDKITSLPFQALEKIFDLMSEKVKTILKRIFNYLDGCGVGTLAYASNSFVTLSSRVCDVPKGVANPRVKSAASRGRAAHRDAKEFPEFYYGPDSVDLAGGLDEFLTEVTPNSIIPGSGNMFRFDAIDPNNKIIYELKPNTASGLSTGEKQLKTYKAYMDSLDPEWEIVLVTYDV